MLLDLLFVAAAFAATDAGSLPAQSVHSINNEFIFSQYPPRALAAGEQGSVKFRVEIDEKGIIQNCKVTGSSGHERLDVETCNLLVEHVKFKPVLDSEGQAREAVHDGVVNWRIPGASSPIRLVTASSGNGGGDTPDKVVCKRIQKTGSLVGSSRVCMTAREWAMQNERYQDEIGALQGRQGSTNGH